MQMLEKLRALRVTSTFHIEGPAASLPYVTEMLRKIHGGETAVVRHRTAHVDSCFATSLCHQNLTCMSSAVEDERAGFSTLNSERDQVIHSNPYSRHCIQRIQARYDYAGIRALEHVILIHQKVCPCTCECTCASAFPETFRTLILAWPNFVCVLPL